MKLNIAGILGIAPKMDDFIENLEKGVVAKPFPPNHGYWRVSSLVQLWDNKSPRSREEKLFEYLVNGKEEKFDTATYKIFDMGHKVHDLVKQYFYDSPHFRVLGDEVPIRHPDLPLTGTTDLQLTWDKYEGEKFVVEIKSVNTENMERPMYGARYKPFKKHRWQAGIYSVVTGYKPIVVYYDKNNSNMVAHLLKEEDYLRDVEEIFETLERIRDRYNEYLSGIEV